jgi:hypothetical protein
MACIWHHARANNTFAMPTLWNMFTADMIPLITISMLLPVQNAVRLK